MGAYTRRIRRRDGKSAGGAVVNIMLFFGGTALILAVVIFCRKGRFTDLPSAHHPEDFENSATPVSPVSDLDYQKRGFQPNRISHAPGKTDTPPTPPPATPRFVGDADWKQYHRLDCPKLKYVEESRRKLFATGDEAFAAGYIPCRVCAPDAPTQQVSNPTTPVPPRDPAPKNPTNPKKTDEPVSLPIRDVTVPFEFKVAGRDVINERGAIRVEYEVDVQKPLMKDETMLLAQKIVAQETAKGPLNAVTMTIRLDPRSTSMLRWICVIDWAPWGVLSRAGEIRTGDYRNHRFNIYDQGFFNPKR